MVDLVHLLNDVFPFHRLELIIESRPHIWLKRVRIPRPLAQFNDKLCQGLDPQDFPDEKRALVKHGHHLLVKPREAVNRLAAVLNELLQ